MNNTQPVWPVDDEGAWQKQFEESQRKDKIALETYEKEVALARKAKMDKAAQPKLPETSTTKAQFKGGSKMGELTKTGLVDQILKTNIDTPVNEVVDAVLTQFPNENQKTVKSLVFSRRAVLRKKQTTTV